MADDDGFPSIGSAADSILGEDDYEIAHKLTTKFAVPSVGGNLEVAVSKDLEGEFKYATRIFDKIDVELSTDHTFAGGTLSNSVELLDGLSLTLESEMGVEKGAVSHKVDIAYSTPVNFLIFRGLEARAAYIPAEKAAEGEIALHADTLSVKVNGQQSLEAGSSPTYCALAELRGDICTLSATMDPGAEDEAEQRAAALHVKVTDSTQVACSLDGQLNWQLGAATQVDADTDFKVKVDPATNSVSCALSRKLRPELSVLVTGAINGKKLTDATAHRWGLQALYEM